MQNRKKYLIFGNGFIAGNYAPHLLKKGYGVRVIYRSKPNPTIPLRIQKKIKQDIRSLKKEIGSYRPDYVILTQGLSFIPHNEKDLENSISSNVIAPVKVMEAIYLLKKENDSFPLPKKILTFGSAAEYGNGRPFTESTPPNPTSLYGLSKNWLYHASKYYSRLGLPVVHLRQFNAIGSGQNPFFAIPAFCRQIAMMENGLQKPVLIVGDLNQKRDFIDIRDAISAYDAVLKNAKSGQVVNICSGKSYHLKEVVNNLKKMAKIKFDIQTNKDLIKEAGGEVMS